MTTPSRLALAQATQQRTRNAEAAITRAIAEASQTSARITLAGIAAKAGVSPDFIYRRPALRAQVEHLRQQSRKPLKEPPADIDEAREAASPLVRRLMHQITRERAERREEVGRLRSALEAAHGELLILRRRLSDNPAIQER